MVKKLIDDENFIINYHDKRRPKGKDTLVIRAKKKKIIIEINDEGIVNVTEEPK
jgi:hypothetical protein